MKKYVFFFIMAMLFSSCAENITRMAQYPKMYEEKPVTIAVMPPINQTPHVEAKEYFYTTLYVPLCEKGYYVFSPLMLMEMYQEESAYDAELFVDSDLSKFRTFLGADAVMFTVIKEWKKNVVAGEITVDVEFILRSAKTNELLYKREGNVTVETRVNSGGGFGMLGALVDMAATAAVTAAKDKIDAGRKCSFFVLSDMPEGKYGTMYDKDQKHPAGKSYVKKSIH